MDAIRRDWLQNGELARWVARGVRGVTSNPTIFQSAISGSEAYSEQLADASRRGLDATSAYWELACCDISEALELLRPVHDESGRRDGYVSLEVDPALARDAASTKQAALELRDRLSAPNLHVKVPATDEGVVALGELVGERCSVNSTLIFAVDRYRQVAEAYLSGLERVDGDLSAIDSVASFFVSRVDAEVDSRLDALGTPEAWALRGSAALANAALAVEAAGELYRSERFSALRERGARPQRLLWASTAPKNPAVPPTHYVERLVTPGTVNTMPPATLAAAETVDLSAVPGAMDADAARRVFDALESVGVDMADVAATLEAAGVAAFEQSFADLLDEIERRMNLVGA